MTQLLEMFECTKCANIVEVIRPGTGGLVCCGEAMKHLKEGVTDAAQEKHVPVVEKTANGYKVTVGSVAHPMEEKHYIEWIELIADGVSYTKFLQPGDAPVAEFCITAEEVTAREHCNLHGLWKS